MPDPAWHYREAERLLNACDGGDITAKIHLSWMAKAQVHAILALAQGVEVEDYPPSTNAWRATRWQGDAGRPVETSPVNGDML